MMLSGLSLAFTEDGGILFGLFAILALIGLICYYLQKTMFMGFETSGGGTYGFAFKASVLEGVGVDINRVEGTIAYVNSLISSASLGETFVEQKQTQVLGGRQATMLASTPAPAAPPVYALDSCCTTCNACSPTGCRATACSGPRTSSSGHAGRAGFTPGTAGSSTRTCTATRTARCTSGKPAAGRHRIALATGLTQHEPLSKGGLMCDEGGRMADGGTKSVRGLGCRSTGQRRRNQAGVSQVGQAAPSRPKSGRRRSRGEVQGSSISVRGHRHLGGAP